ncbi:MAG TPA: hypothetical protein VFU81_14810 [Thermomicrobiales bacterium]|nr:hypothetical protein [Thermomicrobiales bacterium]
MRDIRTVDPEIETASDAGRVVADPASLVATGPELTAPAARTRRQPFAARVQAILIVVMLVAFVFILQRFSKDLYMIGLPLLVVAAFLQIAFGNIPPQSGFVKSMGLLVMTWAIMAAVWAASIYLAPHLIALGQQGVR